jgi:hypothetical protein
MKVNLNKPGLRESVIFSEFIFSAFDPKEKVLSQWRILRYG